MKLSNPYYSEEELVEIGKIANVNPLQSYKEIQRLASMFNGSHQNYVSHWVTTADPFHKKIWFSEDFSHTIEWEFEGLGFPIPCGFHRYLSLYFGEYMQLPPVEQRGNHHNNAIFDPDRPYTEYQTCGVV